MYSECSYTHASFISDGAAREHGAGPTLFTGFENKAVFNTMCYKAFTDYVLLKVFKDNTTEDQLG